MGQHIHLYRQCIELEPQGSENITLPNSIGHQTQRGKGARWNLFFCPK